MVVLPNFVGKNVLLVQVVSVDICIRKGKTLHSYKAFKEKLVPGRWIAQAFCGRLGTQLLCYSVACHQDGSFSSNRRCLVSEEDIT